MGYTGGWRVERGPEDTVHIIPNQDWKEHVAHSSCWCRPIPDDEEVTVVIHHSMDRREEYEQGRPLE